MKLAAARHLRDMGDSRFFWDRSEALLRIKFFSLLSHYKGESAGAAFALEPWQQFIVGSVYGWKMADTKRRRFRYVYIEVPRKNGKTTLSAGFSIMGLICGASNMRPEAGAEIYSTATKEDQAKISWNDARLMVKRSEGLSEMIVARMKELKFDDADAIFRPLGADSLTLDGLNPYVAIMDELHAWPNRDLWDVITDAIGARAEPLIVQITTAGYNQQGICYEQRRHVCALLDGKADYADEAYFGIVYTIDEGDDPFAEATWFKANPNLGVSKSLEFMRDEAARARMVPSKRNAFMNKQLDVWTEQAEVWIPSEKWDRGNAPIDLASLPGNPCVGGLDLASVGDIAALVWEFRVGEHYVLLPRLFIPEDRLRERVRKDRVPYDQWVRDGHLITTPGDLIDYAVIRSHLLADAALFQPSEIAFDRWNANDTVTILTEAGMKMVPFGQGYASMSPAAKAFETDVVGGRVIHGGHPVLRWMMSNVVLTRDPAGNIKPDKAKSREKIDGIVASVMAHGRLMLQPANSGSGVGISFI